MSTRGKSWKWPEGAKRKWNWSKEKREAKTKYKCDDKRIVRCFKWMQARCIRTNRRNDFPRTKIGFANFCKEMGPIPVGMKRPSVGRKNHNKGYVYGNIVWERYEYNVWKNRRTEEEAKQLKITLEQESENEIPF